MLTGRCLCLYVELETVFTFGHLTKPGACRSTIEDRSPTTSDRVSFSDLVEVVVQWSICMLMKEDTKMSLFQPNCRIENCTPRSFSATTSQSRPLNACHYTTQQALSVHLCSIVSTPSLPYLDEKSKNRLNSRMHGETVAPVSVEPKKFFSQISIRTMACSLSDLIQCTCLRGI